jgi:hypothetical protein
MTEQLLDTPRPSGPNQAPAAEATPDRSAPTEGWVSEEGNAFEYIPVSPWGPIALVLGVLALSGFLGLFGLFVALAASVVGVLAVSRIRAAEGLVKGKWMALTGMFLAVFSLTVGSAKMAYDYSTECPEGFQRVNFPKDIAAKQFIYLGGIRKLHPDVVQYVNQPLFLKGFMWQTRDTDGIRGFVLLKDNGECCFGGKPQPYDMMWVELKGEQTTKAYTGMVAVAGTLRVNLEAGEDEAVYLFDADMVEEARTAF